MARLFEELQQEGEKAIDRWIGEERGEDLNFDCKAKVDPSKPKLDRDDRKNLGKALCAFANSDGGLLLWGVDARDENGVDRIVDKRPIAKIKAFRSNVEHAIADLVSPPILGLEILEITCAQSTEAGYLAISIPCSERRPHMSRSNSEQGFYFRNGHQTLLMEVSHVRDQMLRRTVSTLDFEWDIRMRHDQIVVNAQNPTIPLSLDLVLRNNSVVSARFPYLIVQFDRARYISVPAAQYRQILENDFPISAVGPIKKRRIVVDARYNSQDWEFTGGADCCIHPGTALRIAEVKLRAPADLSTYFKAEKGQRTLAPRYGELPTVILEISYGCLNAPSKKVSVELDADEMRGKLFSHGLAGQIVVPQKRKAQDASRA